jgi:ABC-type sugar transport system substrate-binding protein
MNINRVFTKNAIGLLAICMVGSVFAESKVGIHSHLNNLIKEYSAKSSQMSNSDLAKFYGRQGFSDYLKTYPVDDLAGGFVWKVGMGKEYIGPVSKLPIKAPFSDYLPIPAGPVLDVNKKYRIGFAYHGANHPWLVSLADTAVHEASLHANIQLEVIDSEFDDNKMGQVIDNWIAQKYDAIVMWPSREAPMGPPVDRAIRAGIPVVSLDRRTSSTQISSEVLGNFYANGLQQGLYLNHVTGGKGNLIMNRKPLGSTADSIRTGSFLEAVGDQSYVMLDSFHTDSQRSIAFDTTRNALQAHNNIDIIFNTGADEGLGALDAVREAGRLNSASNGKKIIFLLNDDSREAVEEVRLGNVDMVSPYTPLLGDIGVRAAIMHIAFKEGRAAAPPKQIITPNLPMITQKKMVINGIETITPSEWPYSFGPTP